MPNSIIRLPSLLLFLSNSICKSTLLCTSSPKWLSLAIIPQLQLQSHCLEHSSTLFYVSVTIWLICQILYNDQDKSTKEATHFQGLYQVLSILAKQFCLFLDQVLSLQTTILTGRMLSLILLLILLQLIDLSFLLAYSKNLVRVTILMNSWLIYLADLLTLLILIRFPDLILIQGELKPIFLTLLAALSIITQNS